MSALISEDWLNSHEKRISEIRELWQETQRIAIGSSYELISARLSKAQREVIGEIAGSRGKNPAPLLNDYVSKLLDKLVDDSIDLWLPLAEEFLHNGSAASAKRFTPRIILDEASEKDLGTRGPTS